MNAISTPLLIAIALLGSTVLTVLEWRQSDQRNRFARLAASLAAVAALTLLGIRNVSHETEVSGSVEAVLWTSDARSVATEPAKQALHFALAGAENKPTDAITIPDIGYLRRHHPAVTRLHVTGDGLEPFDLAALEGVELTSQPSVSQPSEPTISFLHAPRQVNVGDEVRVNGMLEGLRPGEQVVITLTSPDGAKTERTVSGKNEGGIPFELFAGSTKTDGRFAWRLTMARGAAPAEVLLDERIGIAVVRPMLPRLLVLESSARLDTAQLQRWFAELGGTFAARTLVAQGRYRFRTTADNPDAEFSTLNSELLADVDVLVTDSRAYEALAPDERDAITAAIAEQGLGLLVLPAGESSLGSLEQVLGGLQLEQIEDAQSSAVDGRRSARLQWPGLARPLEQPVAIDNFRITPERAGTNLVSDSQGAPVLTAKQHGRGWIGISLATETWRWRLADEPATFASYWSFVLTRLSRPAAADMPQWRVANSGAAPLLVNQPVELILTGPIDPPPPAQIAADQLPERTRLPLAEDIAEPRMWRGIFWPRKSGWHRVSMPQSGASLDFFVHERHEWASLTGPRRRAATAVAIAKAKPAVRELRPVSGDQRLSDSDTRSALFYAVFLVSVSYLWFEKRRVTA